MAEDDAARLDDGEGLEDFCGHTWQEVTSITKNDIDRSQMRPGVPDVDSGEDLLDLGFGGLLPVKVADLVLAGDWREIEGNDFSIGGQVMSNVYRSAAFGGAKFDDFFGLEVVDDFAEDVEFLGGDAEIAGHGKEQFGGAGKVNLREEFFDGLAGDTAVTPPG